MVDCGPVGPACPGCGGGRGCSRCAVPVTESEMLHASMDARGDWRTDDGRLITGIVSGVDPDEARVLVDMLRTLRPGQTIALPSGAQLRRSWDHHYRPTDGSPALSPETSAMIDQDNQRDLAKFDRFPDVQDALRHLRAQLVAMTGIPPVHMDAGRLHGPGLPAGTGEIEPYATDRNGNVWRLDEDENAYSATSDLRPPIATVREIADREIAQRKATDLARREHDIRDRLSDAHERTTGQRLAAHRPNPYAEQRAAARAEREAEQERESTRRAWSEARAAERGQRRAYVSALALPVLHTRNRAYAARASAISAPVSVMLYVGADLAGSVLLAILAAVAFTLAVCAGVRAVSEHGALRRVHAERIEPARATYDGACTRLSTAEVAYVLAGGDPWAVDGQAAIDAESV